MDEENGSRTNQMATFSGEQAPIAAPVDEQKAPGLKTPSLGTPEQQEVERLDNQWLGINLIRRKTEISAVTGANS
ncbi:hypothetical protein Y032_0013g2005 [Ancylostoma ceylanicum]|uniref:Uncharacterized protein n=1 Tax=Ancylostoma ceylanicum TaxID=53326 RepID=A0A016VAE5_9BILA|nr:hypothetical protein Y032_0013g2005 [Ancylostoma ceylanicum]